MTKFNEAELFKVWQEKTNARCNDAEFYFSMMASEAGTITFPAEFVLDLMKKAIKWDAAAEAAKECRHYDLDDLVEDIFDIHEKVVEDDN